MSDRYDPTEASEGVAPGSEAESAAAEGASHDEVAVLHAELERVRSELREAEERALRARAELDTLRRRQAGELERAHHTGRDAVLTPVLSVHDDLERALGAAKQSDDPSSIIPGIEAVQAGLLRALERLGLEPTGAPGEVFNADLHEAIMAIPSEDPGQIGTIQTVFERGFVQGERLVRPARVVVYTEA
jgi:molecular chaperone GrpE